MKYILLIIYLNTIFNFGIPLTNEFKNINYKLNGVYIIKSLSNEYFNIKNGKLFLSDIQTHFRFVNIYSNLYYIQSKVKNLKLGIDNNDKIKLYDKNNNININRLYWYIYNININQFLIQNKHNMKFIEVDNKFIKCNNNSSIFYNKNNNKFLNRNLTFIFVKLFDEGKFNKKSIYFIKKEPIDVLIKYIDLSDIQLNRTGIKQIYKDKDNEELRFSIRSILENIPWIRKIYILMPNKRVKYFKSIEEINDKIIYIKDKDLLGYDSANIFAFTFNLYKMEKFGISKNFIYMEDDFFIGKTLKKQDFFFYDEKDRKVRPYLITKYFNERTKLELIDKYNNLFKQKNLIHPHSSKGWWFSIYTTEKYFIEYYNLTNFITTQYSHNAIAENIDELKEIFEQIQNYEYINETLFSKERHILTLNQPYFLALYQLNIKHRLVHTINYRYIGIELINKIKINNYPLFVLNTGGNHIPLNRQYKIQKKVMERRFPSKNIYELRDNNYIKIKKKNYYYSIIKLFIIFNFVKNYYILKNII